MKHWKETAEILARAARVAEAGGRAAVAMVVRIEGSAYRRPGARFLVEESGETSGSVSRAPMSSLIVMSCCRS